MSQKGQKSVTYSRPSLFAVLTTRGLKNREYRGKLLFLAYFILKMVGNLYCLNGPLYIEWAPADRISIGLKSFLTFSFIAYILLPFAKVMVGKI